MAIRSPHASPFGRGAPEGGGEGPLSHGQGRASSPKGGAKKTPNSNLYTKQKNTKGCTFVKVQPFAFREGMKKIVKMISPSRRP